MKILYFVVITVGCMSLAGCIQAVHVPQVSEKSPIYLSSSDTKIVAFERGVVKINRGEQIGTVLGGLACVGQPGGRITWKGGKVDISSDEMVETFGEELKKQNYNVVGDTKALFGDKEKSAAELLVAALITDIKVNICYPHAGFGNWSDSKGEGYIKTEWQVYSPLDKKEIFRTTTEGSLISSDSSTTGANGILNGAFASATRNLLADKKFSDLVVRQKNTKIIAQENIYEKIKIKPQPKYKNKFSENVSDIKLKVVTVRTATGHGSGFVVAENYILTNQHVVGEARYVKIITCTGTELSGEVIRRDPVRDVSLIRTEPIGLEGIPLSISLPQVGDDVFAVGTPLKESFGGTVTKGIISGFRLEKMSNYIQSDVSVQPGNSGGPLLDINGNVIGLSVSGYFVRGAATNINFFIPIKEALSAMSIDVLD